MAVFRNGVPRAQSKLLFWVALGAGFCVVVSGCGPGYPDTTPVTGKVSFNGRAVPQGRIMFFPEQGRPAMGRIGTDGSYTLTTFRPNDGAILGTHRVTIKSIKDVAAPTGVEDELAPAVITWIVPEIYSNQETTPLRAEVKRENNTINFALKP